MPDHSLNYAVLHRSGSRGQEAGLPGAERVLLAVKGCPDRAALPQDREALTMKHVLGVLEANPARGTGTRSSWWCRSG